VNEVDLIAGDVLEFLRDVPRLKHRAQLVADVRRLTRDGRVRAECLVNLFVNSECASGQSGVDLATYLVSRGVDAARVSQNAGTESWVVLVNPAKVLRRTVVDPRKEIEWDLPLVPSRWKKS
jgi:hypothetical protein